MSSRRGCGPGLRGPRPDAPSFLASVCPLSGIAQQVRKIRKGREAVGDGRATHGRILPQPATRQKPTAPRATRATARPENRFGKWSKPPCSGAIAAVRPWPPTGPSRRYGRQQTGARRGRQQAQVAVARTTGYTQRGSPIRFPHRCQNQPSWPVPVSPCSWPWRPRLPGGCSAWSRSTCAATRCWCCWRRSKWRRCRPSRATPRCPSSQRRPPTCRWCDPRPRRCCVCIPTWSWPAPMARRPRSRCWSRRACRCGGWTCRRISPRSGADCASSPRGWASRTAARR